MKPMEVDESLSDPHFPLPAVSRRDILRQLVIATNVGATDLRDHFACTETDFIRWLDGTVEPPTPVINHLRSLLGGMLSVVFDMTAGLVADHRAGELVSVEDFTFLLYTSDQELHSAIPDLEWMPNTAHRAALRAMGEGFHAETGKHLAFRKVESHHFGEWYRIVADGLTPDVEAWHQVASDFEVSRPPLTYHEVLLA